MLARLCKPTLFSLWGWWMCVFHTHPPKTVNILRDKMCFWKLFAILGQVWNGQVGEGEGGERVKGYGIERRIPRNIRSGHIWQVQEEAEGTSSYCITEPWKLLMGLYCSISPHLVTRLQTACLLIITNATCINQLCPEPMTIIQKQKMPERFSKAGSIYGERKNINILVLWPCKIKNYSKTLLLSPVILSEYFGHFRVLF